VTAKPSAASPERRYALRAVKQRLHQASFREAVITGYGCLSRCYWTPPVLRTKEEKSGHPVVPNGTLKFTTSPSMLT
jgi:putative restriction endonuclease